ncbi:hypothetical protein Ccr2_gp283 [Caulobacter phage Ccr2]|nr:hypothetical protein Ccr10_gp284 [Caulobacter phage Ccr10]ARB14159.1 hypothetical protein Ccr2_gp283 [Caulobacter phage Ccr2]ARB14853.1 hypothetical protein Ccr29_gp297 [Caulobacter phage Ccr29]
MTTPLCLNPDGADFQAQAVLALVRFVIGDDFEPSWNAQKQVFEGEPQVAHFDSPRCHGYVIWLVDRRALALGGEARQINIVFYQHGVSDEIVINAWLGETNRWMVPTYHDMPDIEKMFRRVTFRCLDVKSAAYYVADLMKDFWAEGSPR